MNGVQCRAGTITVNHGKRKFLVHSEQASIEDLVRQGGGRAA
jgi:hypothetical protein